MDQIKPKLATTCTTVDAGFTLANRKVVNQKGEIPGLNFGDNTGVSPKELNENIECFLEEMDWSESPLAMAEQVHGSNIKVVDEPGMHNGVDALITSSPGLTLGIKVADCAAILLADETNSIIAAVHAGWRGAVADILPKTLFKMDDLGAEPSNIRAYISPCLSQQVFEVGIEVAEKFPEKVVDYQNYNKPHIDLKGFLVDQLHDFGLANNQIEVDEGCTLSDGRYYSFRRERERSGRMLGYIRINQ